jgi:hypothetical protein
MRERNDDDKRSHGRTYITRRDRGKCKLHPYTRFLFLLTISTMLSRRCALDFTHICELLSPISAHEHCGCSHSKLMHCSLVSLVSGVLSRNILETVELNLPFFSLSLVSPSCYAGDGEWADSHSKV